MSEFSEVEMPEPYKPPLFSELTASEQWESLEIAFELWVGGYFPDAESPSDILAYNLDRRNHWSDEPFTIREPND